MSPIRLTHVSYERVLIGIFTALMFTAFVAYALYQARNLIEGPVVVLDGTYPAVHESRVVTLHGTAENVVLLTVNGREIHTDREGHFSHDLMLENGYTLATIEAVDRFGRKTRLTEEFVFAPEA